MQPATAASSIAGCWPSRPPCSPSRLRPPRQPPGRRRPPVKETDAYPKSMGFRINTANVDKAKFPRHEVDQKCSGCQLFSGKPGEPLGTCSFFKRLVPPDGWCRNFKPQKAAA